MSTATPTVELAPPPRLFRLSVEKYDEMARLGLLSKYDRVELIEGILVEKMTKNERHIATTSLLQADLNGALPPGWFAVTEWPVRLPRSMPEPDVMIVRGRIQDYFRRKPVPADLALLIEVSDSSCGEDRVRCSYYAESGVATCWIANIPAGRIEVYSTPTRLADGFAYETRVDHAWDDEVSLAIEGQAGVRLRVSELLAPPE